MSRIGKQPISVPTGVTISQEGASVFVRGDKGELTVTLPNEKLQVVLKNKNTIAVVMQPPEEMPNWSAFWGLSRALLANAVIGVATGFEKRLVIEGVGYRAEMKGNDLVLRVGFSHDIIVKPPEGITIQVEKNIITVSGIDKHLVGEVSAGIRKHKKPEPYKGKGIHYEGEHIRRKEGKKASAGM